MRARIEPTPDSQTMPRTVAWWKLYRGRGAIEREFGRLKNEWALLPLRVRGLERVQLHADLTIFAKLSCALARARAAPLRLVVSGLLPGEIEAECVGLLKQLCEALK